MERRQGKARQGSGIKGNGTTNSFKIMVTMGGVATGMARGRQTQTKHRYHSNKVIHVPHLEPHDQPGEALRCCPRSTVDSFHPLHRGPRALARDDGPAAALLVVSAAPDVVSLTGILLFRGCGLRFMLLLLLFRCKWRDGRGLGWRKLTSLL
jgi:hypothetical protein